MSSLSYITRASSSPQGKPRVWLCCHPADQARFLEPLAKELLAAADCALWYDPDPAASLSEEERAEREADLAAMQLFVLPVTGRLLTVPSPALDWQFPLAQRQHIPVLPILQEPGLEALFNEKCGELQCLDPNQTDPTALPYAEKLKKFLEGVLVGDELAAKVRAAFDAYIFLSYRKKDRRQAQALMWLIHQNDFCRDIAIWYDEFLTPGEDFNAAIAQALDKSRLFVLAVTPNLLEKPNYVMEEEFPRARDGGKAILPVEMDPTDRAGLEKAYPGIPACGAPSFPEIFYQLRALLPELAKRELPDDPAHNYFIGLAYLSGIDVEVDKARGLALIRAAARDGLPEAVEKMAAVYRTGEGVARDYRAAVQWQERLVDIRRAEWERAPSANSFLRYANPLWALAEDYTALEDNTNAIDIWKQEFLPLCQQAAAQKLPSAPRYLSIAHEMIGKQLSRQGEGEAAAGHLLQAVKLRLDLTKKKADRKTVRDLFLSFVSIGTYHLESGGLADARVWFKDALRLSEADERSPSSFLSRPDTAVLYTRMGTLCQKEGDPAAARRWWEKALALRFQQAKESESEKWKEGPEISSLFQKLGALCFSLKDYDAARRWWQDDIDLLQKMVNKSNMVTLRRQLAYAYYYMSFLCPKSDGSTKAWLQKSLELYKQLANELGSEQALHDLALALYHLGSLPGEKIYLLQKSFRLLSDLAKDHPAVPAYTRDLSRVWDALLRRENDSN